MEEGSLRCDVNTSLAPRGSGRLGTRTETKNVNSLRSVERAVRYEIERQAAVLDAGHRVVQETRHFHEDSGVTTAGRSKEEAQDYRYFPEPDLVPIAPSREWVEKLRGTLPELPSARRARLQSEWNLSDLDMAALANAGALDLVEQAVAAGTAPAEARKWWLGELRQRANAEGVELTEFADRLVVGRAAISGTSEAEATGTVLTPAEISGAGGQTAGGNVLTPAQVLAQLSRLVTSGAVNDKLARQVLDAVLAGQGSPDEIVAARGLAIVRDDRALLAAVDAAIAANPEVAEKIRGGKTAAAGVLVGAVMKSTRGQADAARVRELILDRLGQH
jgi:aspartyl-tRNA(Asn)/glutamyl-tRNA(Gln) amidotransferase subunit B